MKNIHDPVLATTFTVLGRAGFSIRFLYQHLYEMTPEEAEHAWQLYKDEQTDMSEAGIRQNLNKREVHNG